MPSLFSIVRGTNNKPASSRALADIFPGVGNLEGELFVGYPIISSPEGRYPIDAVWVSPRRGVVVFDLIEGTHPTEFWIRQDDIANKLDARLRTHRELVDCRNLVVPIHTVSFAPGINSTEAFAKDGYPLTNKETLASVLQKFNWRDSSYAYYAAVLSALQSISTIRKSRTKRVPIKEDSKGAKLKRLEDSIATLDNMQGKAVIETVEGVQRIRGLAGSGKTIVLALKAAYLHAQHPDWRIAVTFQTRSLKGQLKRLINTFSIEQTGEEPDWNHIRVLNAWGAPGDEERAGIYHEFCQAANVPYYDFRAAKSEFGQNNVFGSVCSHALSYSSNKPSLYDAILVDEAQDFPTVFLKLCYEILNEKKRLVYAYDELQNLSETTLPPPSEIFGNSSDGTPRVTFPSPVIGEPRHDIILEKCYRNSRPVLVTAHSLGFGIYRQKPKNRSTGLVQMFDEAELWRDIGYEVENGALEQGREVTLKRKSEASPKFLEQHSPVDDLIEFVCFESEEEQRDWVVKEILENLSKDELRHDDIVVINPEPLTTRTKSGLIRAKLLEQGVSSHLAGVDTDPDVFFQTNSPSITFTGIYRAKGNEAGMVYIINAHDCHSSSVNLATIRNRLFTAITRSKAWVRVVGVGLPMQNLIDEYMELKNKDFELRFRYPTLEEREQLSIVHRDMTAEDRRRLSSTKKSVRDLMRRLDEGKIYLEDLGDLGPELLDRLNALQRDEEQ